MDLQPLLLQALLRLHRGRGAPPLLNAACCSGLGIRRCWALLVLGRATLSRILWTNGREQCSWSADYFLHSPARRGGDPQELFAPLLKEALQPLFLVAFIGVAVDDTRVRKTGRTIAQAAYHRDPLSPPFHTNLILALRFLQASLLLPLHRLGEFSARAIPIRFEEVSTVKKPGKRRRCGGPRAIQRPPTLHPLATLSLPRWPPSAPRWIMPGAQLKILIIAGDATFCNRTVLRGLPDRHRTHRSHPQGRRFVPARQR